MLQLLQFIKFLSRTVRMRNMGQIEPATARLDLQKVACRYSVSRRTVQRWLDRGLPFSQVTPRSKILVKPEDVEEFLTPRCKTQVDLNALADEVMAEIVAKKPR